MYYGTKRKYGFFIFLSLLIPVLLGGLRYNVGTDYGTYIDIFNGVSALSVSDFISQNTYGLELGFFALIKLSEMFQNNPELMFVFANLLTIIMFYLGLIRYKLHHRALVYTLYLFTIFPFTLNLVRQGIAMSICFLAFSYLIERKPKQYIFWIVIASFFHISAIILLPFYFINKFIKLEAPKTSHISITKIILLALVFLTMVPVILDFVLNLSFFEKYSAYQGIVAMGNNYTFYLKLLTASILLVFYKQLIAISKYNLYFIAFVVLNAVISMLGFSSDIFNRITLYLSFYNLIPFTGMIDVFDDRLGKYTAYTIILTYAVGYFYFAFYVLGQADIFPFYFLWDKA